MEGIVLFMVIHRIPDSACSPANEYLQHLRHLWEFVWDHCSGWVTVTGASKVLSAASSCIQTYHNCSPHAPVWVIRDPSYSEALVECPSRGWFSPAIGACKFTCQLISYTPEASQWQNVFCWYRAVLWRWWSSTSRDTLGDHNQVSLEMHREVMIEQCWWCSWRWWSSKS